MAHFLRGDIDVVEGYKYMDTHTSNRRTYTPAERLYTKGDGHLLVRLSLCNLHLNVHLFLCVCYHSVLTYWDTNILNKLMRNSCCKLNTFEAMVESMALNCHSPLDNRDYTLHHSLSRWLFF